MPNYCFKYYDYIVNWCSGIACSLYVSLDIALILALIMEHICFYIAQYLVGWTAQSA